MKTNSQLRQAINLADALLNRAARRADIQAMERAMLMGANIHNAEFKNAVAEGAREHREIEIHKLAAAMNA